MVKLVFSDLDGTFLTPDKTITADNARVLDAAYERGVHFVPCTGRNIADISGEILQHPAVSHAVCCNGAQVLDVKTGAVLHEVALDKATVLDLYRSVRDLRVTFDIFADRRVYTPRSRFGYIETVDLSAPTRDFIRAGRTVFDEPVEELLGKVGDVCRLNIFFHTRAERDEVWRAVDARPSLIRTTSLACNVEITDARAHKGAALAWLCGLLGVSPADVVAFGDNENDITMLRAAGDGVAMANAVPACRAASDHMTSSCDDSGVARYLSNLFGIQA